MVHAKPQDVYQRFVAVLTFYYPLGARLPTKESYIPTLQIQNIIFRETVIFSIYLHVRRFNLAHTRHAMLKQADTHGIGIYNKTILALCNMRPS